MQAKNGGNASKKKYFVGWVEFPGIPAWGGAEFLEQGFDSMILPAFS